MKYTDIDKAIERLEECGRLEGCETGGMWISIAELWTSYQDYISDELKEVLEKEIIREAERTHTEFKIVKKTETYTSTIETLEYIG